MKELVKINSIGLEKLNNAEYTNFMSRFREEVATATPEKLGLTADELTSLDASIAKMQDLVAKSRISDNTVKLAELDNERDNIVIYIMAEIDNKRRSPLANVKAAAISLHNATHQYKGIQKVADQQETQKINGLLLDLAKPENAPNATLLGLDEVIVQLSTTNTEYANITAERTHEKTDTTTDNSKTVRSQNDKVYDHIVTMAFVTSVATPSVESSTFVTNTNALIDETNTRYNQRRSAEKAHKKV